MVTIDQFFVDDVKSSKHLDLTIFSGLYI